MTLQQLSWDVIRNVFWTFLEDQDALNWLQCNHKHYALLSEYTVKSTHTHLDFISVFQKSSHIHKDIAIPYRLTSLTFSVPFGELPKSIYSQWDFIKELCFDCRFFYYDRTHLPKSLTKLTFTKLWCHMPHFWAVQSLTELTFSNVNFTLSSNMFPSNLKKLVMGCDFNQSLVEGCFPSSLRILYLCAVHKQGEFNAEFKNDILPQELEELHLPDTYDKEILLALLPQSIQNLSIGILTNCYDLNKFHHNLLHLRFISHFHTNLTLNANIFPSLVSLHIGGFYNVCLQPGSLPPSLQALYITLDSSQQFVTGLFPENLKSLSLLIDYRDKTNKNIFSSFPSSLTYLEIEGTYCVPLINLPSSLLTLHLNSTYEHNSPLVLPLNLQTLSLSNSFNQPIEFPNSLTDLSFGYQFNQDIVLPLSLRELALGSEFNKQITVWPPSLQRLFLPTENNRTNDLILPNNEKVKVIYY